MEGSGEALPVLQTCFTHLYSVVENKLGQEFDGQWVHARPGNLLMTNTLDGLASLANLSNQRGVLIPSVVSWWCLNAVII